MNTYSKRILSVTGTGSFLSVVNSSSLLIAIPSIIIDIHVSFLLAIWIIVAYSLSLTVLTPILGKYSDIVGRKRLYSSGYVVFFLGSLISSLAFEGDVLFFGRVVQGIGGALLFSNSLAILTDSFETSELGKAMGINAAIIALGTSIGPLIGGILTEFTWRLIFVFNMPIALYGFFSSRSYIKEISRKAAEHIDKAGALLLSTTVVIAIVFLTVLPGISYSSPLFLSFLLVMFTSLVLFIYQERRSRKPIIDPLLFRIGSFRDSVVALVGGSIARFSILFLLILFLQGPLEKTPLQAGVLIIPFAGAMGAMSFISGSLKGKIPQLSLEVIGLMLTGIGGILLGIFAFMASDYLIYGIIMALAGAGSGIFYTPNSTIIMLSVPPGRRGETAGVRTLMLNLGSVLGLTLVFMIISAFVPSNIVNSIFLGLKSPAVLQYSRLFTDATRLSFLISGILSLIPIPLILITHRLSSMSDKR